MFLPKISFLRSKIYGFICPKFNLVSILVSTNCSLVQSKYQRTSDKLQQKMNDLFNSHKCILFNIQKLLGIQEGECTEIDQVTPLLAPHINMRLTRV